ncbi:phage tail protein [Endozoicomonas sp. 4G]|uniref:phage tail protein n=1 Tax=Endozoicomonas sp. 4G TaxID=2872754 RepID=UPI0020790FEC|nr:phage tail protein [Endozoicomonas sp. 4G]
MIMMILGATVFSVNGNTYDKLTKSTNFSWASQTVIGRQPVYQYLGHGENTINIEGKIYPGQYGSRLELMILEQSAGLGIPMPFFCSSGLSLGAWCITSFKEVDTCFMDTGDPRSIDFTIGLVQYASLADYLTEVAGNLLKSSVDNLGI